MIIKKLKVDDVISLSGCDWKVINTYQTLNNRFLYKDRITMINLETGETIDCANSFS